MILRGCTTEDRWDMKNDFPDCVLYSWVMCSVLGVILVLALKKLVCDGDIRSETYGE
jgi:hypothetical protein